jgi:hypothetical protein
VRLTRRACPRTRPSRPEASVAGEDQVDVRCPGRGDRLRSAARVATGRPATRPATTRRPRAGRDDPARAVVAQSAGEFADHAAPSPRPARGAADRRSTARWVSPITPRGPARVCDEARRAAEPASTFRAQEREAQRRGRRAQCLDARRSRGCRARRRRSAAPRRRPTGARPAAGRTVPDDQVAHVQPHRRPAPPARARATRRPPAQVPLVPGAGAQRQRRRAEGQTWRGSAGRSRHALRHACAPCCADEAQRPRGGQ